MVSINKKEKISLFEGDIMNSYDSAKRRDHAITIQSFDYSLNKSLDSAGVPNEITQTTKVNFVVRLPKQSQLYKLYTKMRDGEPMHISLVFNPQYSSVGELEEYSAAIVIRGSILSMQQSYLSNQTDIKDRMVMHISIIANSIFYLASSFKKMSPKPLELKIL